MKVLFVDDDADVREAYGQALGLAGFDVTLARALIEAVDHLSPGFPGVVVTDIRMPGRDGFDMMGRVHKVDPKIPVIILTGEGDIPMAARAIKGGAFAFLEKPCPPADLIAMIRDAGAMRAATLASRSGKMRVAVGQTQPKAPCTLPARMDMVERHLIEAELTRCNGHVPSAAEALGLPRKTMYDKLKRHEIDPAGFRAR
ncbi:response regulator [Actibacterium sp. 188UL27-1]|uniref:response regulator n=1 Tax=Actibacterium sp. 188UL27-1 TaxID=2786961 RepID=UPI0019594A0D|nr:response regulator [Actibacterium sp. 188UL27-1]MBM7070259.1 response regulator [Actibacterium sp. 188UL27-1]